MSKFPVIGSIRAFEDVRKTLERIRNYFVAGAPGSVSSAETAKDSNLPAFSGTGGNVVKDSGISIGDIQDAINKKHIRKHALPSDTDHSSIITPKYLMKADGNGLPEEATNTDAEVADAVIKKHIRQHALASPLDHTSSITSGKIIKAGANGLPSESSVTDTELADAVSKKNDVFCKGGTVLLPSGAVNVIVWWVQFSCFVTEVKGYRVGGTGATINARKNGALNHLSGDLSLTSVDTWMDGGAVQEIYYVRGDKVEIMLTSVNGSPAQVAVQVNFKRGEENSINKWLPIVPDVPYPYPRLNKAIMAGSLFFEPPGFQPVSQWKWQPTLPDIYREKRSLSRAILSGSFFGMATA